ncbi:succinate dehydrogenase cytochrome b subunit [Sphingobacterium sp. N143]|uniref:succinate dehydrogenase cytochrome b subunit n=1 Tax=Sphingobacterium TaxID=28453 RepID=UPI00257845C7|nr:succinate dehydrogenase cytochrome b subunit [Sphingobacterium sp. N143]MDM1296729.1 succinate dehydrogenase cytochrome b subunit [Sphingobacterium sp. N143]
MNSFYKTFTSSLGRKFTMALSGLFLISFLLVHMSVNALIFYNDGGVTFTIGAHFMATNPVIRTLEIVLIAGFVLHIVQGLLLWKKNRDARPIKYAYPLATPKIKWYSKSMTLLGTLLLLFLVIHTSNFWIPNRIHQFRYDEELPLYDLMLEKFSNPFEVLVYLFGCVSLFWHLLHGFTSAFTSLGISHRRYNGFIKWMGTSFSVIVPLVLFLMPLSIYFKWIN